MSDRITQPETSVRDGQRFKLEKDVTVLGVGEPVLTIVNERVSFRNEGTAETTGETPTIEVRADRAAIANREHGVILSEDTGIAVEADDVEIDNEGLIETDGVAIEIVGDDAEIRNFGEIEGASGIRVTGEDAEILNFDEIDAEEAGIFVEGEEAEVYNQGEIDAGTIGIQVNGDDSEITNRGDIDADDAGIEVDGDNLEIDNKGDINGDIDGLRILGEDVYVYNSGTISGDINGVNFVNGGESSGRLLNRGTIESDSRAINIGGDGVSITNRSNILGTDDQRNGTIYSDGSADNFEIVNGRGGTVDAGLGNQGAGLALQIGDSADDTVRAEVTNAGSIDGRGQGAADTGLAGDGIRLFSGDEGGTTFLGDIHNSGDINSESEVGATAAIRISDGLSFDGRITNAQGAVIDGANNGLYFGDAEHNATVDNRGTIQSGSRAVNIDGSDVVLHNHGAILGTDDQRNGTVYADATADNYSIINERRAVIDAGAQNDGAGIALQTGSSSGDTVTAEIVNHGTIEGRGQGAADSGLAGDGIRIFSGAEDGGTTFDGDITNTGRISSESEVGPTAGLRISDGLSYEGRITNERRALIEGENNGLYFGTAEHDATVVNRGTIQSGSRAVNIDGTGVTLNNFGDILGTDDQRNGTVYADVTANDYAVLNQRSGTIDAGAGNNGSGIALQLGANVTATVFNAGEVFGRGIDPANEQDADGIRLFSGLGEEGSTFIGTIENEGLVQADEGDGIDIGAFVALTGNIENEGDIRAGDDGIDIDGALNGSIINDGDIVADDEGIGIQGGASIFAGLPEAVLNEGTIEAGGTGIEFGTSALFVIPPVTGATVTGDVVNDGRITAGGDGIDFVDNTVFAGDVVNNGTIVAVGDGIDVDDGVTFTGDIINNGTIESEDDGIDIDNVSEFNGQIVNNGTVTGDSEGDGSGLAFDGDNAQVDLTVENNGLFNGDVLLSAGNDVFDGADGRVTGTIDGGEGSDTITSGDGDNVLTGGSEADTFVFVDGTDNDSVTDFEDGSDLLDVSAFFDDAADAVAAARQDGEDTVIDLDNNDSVRLVGVDLAQVDETDFLV